MIPRPHFYPRGGKATGEVVIRCIVRVGKQQVYISTGYRCRVRDWDHKRERVRPTARGATITNDRLEEMEMRVRGVLKGLHDASRLTPESLREAWEQTINPPPPPPVEEEPPAMPVSVALTQWRDAHRSLRTDRTVATYETAVVHLEGALGRTRSAITINEIGLTVMQRMVAYMLHDKSLSTVSAWKSARIIRTLVAWCEQRGTAVDATYKSATESALMPDAPSTPSRVSVVLKTAEFQQLRDADLSAHPVVERCRDAWIFQSSTGLRWSDMQQLRPEHRIDDGLDLTTLKNKKTVRVPLGRDARTIWERYGGPPPAISTDKQNEYIKDAARLAGLTRRVRLVMYRGVKREEKTVMIWEVISTHVAKRTFVTALIADGCSIDDVMLITGNTRRTIETYIRLDQEETEVKVVGVLDRR